MAHEPRPEHEVQDTHTWVFFERLFDKAVEWHLPEINLGFYKLQITKFMMLELIAAGLILLIFIPLARRIRNGGLPRGVFWNMFEGMLLFIRDEIARPNLDSEDHGHHEEHGEGHGHGHGEHAHAHAPTPAGTEPALEHHEADKYVPFLWTIFLFVLFCNLLGMIPLMGSPTASIWVTGALALISFVAMNGVAIAKVGFGKYMASLFPKIEMPPGDLFKYMGYVFTIGIGMIEILGIFIKSGVLAVRLFANMFAGHLVLAYILFFIYAAHKAAGYGLLWGTVTIASILGVVGLSLLELFVAFLQAYIFTFLTALFMGMSLHHAEAH